MNTALSTPRLCGKPKSLSFRRSSASRRRAAIAKYEILDTAPEADFDNIALLAARILGTEFAAISFIADDRQWFKAEYGLGICGTPIEHSFCAHAIQSNEIFLIEDAQKDIRFATNPLVTESPHIRFYAGMRVLANDGTPIAALCVLSAKPRPKGITASQRLTLQVLASQLQSLLELRRAVIEQRLQVAAQALLSNKLLYVAEHDELTGLPHRGPFRRSLDLALGEAQRTGTRVAVMLVDVDHFKQINDSLGHDVGDALLCSFAKRLRSCMREPDVVARLGGDEFGVVASGLRHDDEIAAVVRSLNDRLHEPVNHNGRMVDCRASIGIAVYPDHASTAEGLSKCSDLALAAAKIGRGCAATFCSTMADQFERESKMLSIARKGVSDERITPFYQPKLNLKTGSLVGFEALVRCERPDGGEPFLPEAFARAFSDRELASKISSQMLKKVLSDMRRWVDRRTDFGHIAINTCAADFHADDFAERLLAALDAFNLDPGLLQIEVTEGVFLGRGAHQVARALSLLSEKGIRIALDDFGTGFASLTHLKQFPVDILKIDRTFVAGIGKNPDDTAIVRALIDLGKNLGIETVAEGIETSQQAAFVQSFGCAVGQGFLYGPAYPPRVLPALISGMATSMAA